MILLKKKVLVLAGGISAEHSVSLRSGKSVQSALLLAGYAADILEIKTVRLPKNVADYDVVFSVLHGMGGEDGTMQNLLEQTGVPFVGSDSAASSLCFNKSRYRDYLLKHSLPVAAGGLVTADQFWKSDLSALPYVLKPKNGGSSIDTFIVHEPSMAPKNDIQAAFNRHTELLAEKLILGVECTAAVLIDAPLPVIEIIPPAGQDFDYTNKYNGKTQEICPPQSISKTNQKRIQDLALQIHRQTGCRHYSRTDMIITKNYEIFVLETNTLPGMTEQSLFPKAAQAAGFSMPMLVDSLVRAAIRSTPT